MVRRRIKLWWTDKDDDDDDDDYIDEDDGNANDNAVDDEDDVFESKGIKGDLLIVLPNLGHFLTAMSIFFPSFF